MTEKYPFKPGDWIMDEGDFAKVESVFTLYYEPFDIAGEDDAKAGDYKYTVISYHTFCTPRGRVLSSKAQTTYLDVCDWIEPLTPEQETLLEQIKLKKAEALAAWEAKCKEAKECVEIFVNTKKGEAATALSKFRKAAKVLPERFTFSDVQAILRTIPEIKADTASTDCNNKEYINFELCYILKEQNGRCLSFDKIRNFDCFEDLPAYINYEMVYVSLYHLARLYGEETGSEKLRLLTERLAKAGKAMFDPMNRDDELAKDYFRHAPKIFYTFDKAYATIEAFLDRNSKELGVEDFAELVKNKDENILRIYHKVLGI